MFNENSGLVKIWVDAVKRGDYKLEQVPQLSNLKEVVAEVLNGTAV